MRDWTLPFVDSPTPRIGESGSRRLPGSVSQGVADSPYQWVGESPTPHIGESGSRYLIYNKLQNFVSQKIKKLFEPNFKWVFLYTYTASSANLSSLALL